MTADSTQVVIYLDDPKGQLFQVSLGEWRRYWRGIGWSIQDRAPRLFDVEPALDSQHGLL